MSSDESQSIMSVKLESACKNVLNVHILVTDSLLTQQYQRAVYSETGFQESYMYNTNAVQL